MDELPPGIHDLTFQAGASNINRHFYLGPPGSGLPMHSHAASWDALVWGRKYWCAHRRPTAAAPAATTFSTPVNNRACAA
eukprot:scaffold2879_cov269-Prasinococcus_capsulatus_cf.AAC.26